MRIAYVSADPGVPVFGRKGCSIHVQEVLRALVKKGAHIDLFTSNCGGEVLPELASIQVHPLPKPTGELAVREHLSLAANADLERQLQRGAPYDFVYERYSLWSYAGVSYARAIGLPGLLEVNAPLIEEQAKHRGLVDRAGAMRVAEQAFGNATALIAVSGAVAAYLESWPKTTGRVHIIPNGVNPERFPEQTSACSPAPEGIFTIGFVGTLKPWHGVSVLLAAFASFHATNAQSRLLIVGDGPEREKLAAVAARYGLSQWVEFTGAVLPAEIPRWLASMDVAVAPYPQMDHFYFSPLKAYEYMAAGLPVVASRIGQLESLIQDGVNGLLVEPGEAAALEQALAQLHQDPGLRTRLGRAARAKVLKNYTWDSVVARVLDLAGLISAR